MSAIAGLAPQESATAARQSHGRGGALGVSMRPVDGAEWDRLVSGFDGVCQEQLYAFAQMRWPAVVQEPILFERDGKVVGGALVMIQRLPLGLASIAVSKWAPMLAEVDGPDAATIFDGMVTALKAEYAERRGMMLSILPAATVDAVNWQYLALRKQGFRRGSTLLFPNRYIVNLRLGDAEQRGSFHQTWRRQLSKAEKSGLSFEHASRDRIEEFKQLYAAMTERKQFPDHSAYETLDGLMALDEPLRPELFFVRYEGETVAGALIFKAGDRAVYLYGATNDRALPLRAGYFLHWQVIRWLRDNARARWYDLGGTDGYHGLHQFKKGMVGEAGVIRPVPPVTNFASNPLALLLGTAAFVARDFVQHLRRHVEGLRNSKSRPDQPAHITEEYLK